MSELTFVDALPEDARRRRDKTQQRAAELRANPGKWAKWPSQTAASGLRKSLGADFEVTTRQVDGRSRAFVRYVGTGNGTPPAVRPPPRNRESGAALPGERLCGAGGGPGHGGRRQCRQGRAPSQEPAVRFDPEAQQQALASHGVTRRSSMSPNRSRLG